MVHEEKPKRRRKKKQSHSTEGMKEKLSREFAERVQKKLVPVILLLKENYAYLLMNTSIATNHSKLLESDNLFSQTI